MPKMKTNRGAAKRFSLTASGKVKHKKANRRHILTKKAAKRKRHMRDRVVVAKVDADNVKRLMPYA